MTVAASSMAAYHAVSAVPMLTVKASLIAANSATSSRACTMAGDAPTASKTLAIVFIAT
mgnify:CR=1 FL=1